MKTSDVFLDWLYISQRHPGDLPIVGDGVRIKGESFEQCEYEGEKFLIVRPGAEIRYSIPSAQKGGSHNTSLRLRSDGNTVQLSGNVGRFDRSDNMFNYDYADTLDKASSFVNGFGLPCFFAGEETVKETISKRDFDLGLLTHFMERSGQQRNARYTELHGRE